MGTHLRSSKDQTQDRAACKLPRDCLQPSILALKGQGTFRHIRKAVLLVCSLGKAAGLSVLRRLKPSGGIWSLSVPEAGYLSLDKAQE